jgi:hypothetical protein
MMNTIALFLGRDTTRSFSRGWIFRNSRKKSKTSGLKFTNRRTSSRKKGKGPTVAMGSRENLILIKKPSRASSRAQGGKMARLSLRPSKRVTGCAGIPIVPMSIGPNGGTVTCAGQSGQTWIL